jgi:hypothetical protein
LCSATAGILHFDGGDPHTSYLEEREVIVGKRAPLHALRRCHKIRINSLPFQSSGKTTVIALTVGRRSRDIFGNETQGSIIAVDLQIFGLGPFDRLSGTQCH